MFSIGELSKSSGVKVPTIRYYEQIGLLEPTDRSQGNQRRYEAEGLKRLTFIKHARDLGFSLDGIRSLLQLSQQEGKACRKATAIVQEHLTDVQKRIQKLQRLESELDRMLDCHENCKAQCSVLESLSDHSHCLSEH
ncbi:MULTISPECIES: MerR family transcriptional regulator [Cohaesibacter]|uniref:MerR family transcriptional regulator n=1 Tax=Cohaesibacter TaxID=655352 RepID=UPI000DEA7C45|nr:MULTISPECIES: helix-turn-helix domain-containing protein [Cohaesibacter]TLP43379.1 MerR family transcriptional regulator [Cohaesibacter sp. CAU 1516]